MGCKALVSGDAMTFKLDMHVHTKYSGDNDAEPEDVLEVAIAKGLDGIVFTEHYSYEASWYVEELSEKYRNVISIFRAVEFSSAQGHCLIFGLNTDNLLKHHADIHEVIAVVRMHGGVVIPSHPYRGYNSLGHVLKTTEGFSAIEGYNGCNMHGMNEQAVLVAKELNLPFTGGSDAHRPEDVGSCYTLFYEPVTEENLIMLLKSGRYTAKDTRKISLLNWWW